MMSTRRGTPPKPYFLEMRARISLRETEVLESCALMSSAAMPEVTRRSCSAWEGPMVRMVSGRLVVIDTRLDKVDWDKEERKTHPLFLFSAPCYANVPLRTC